MRPMAEKTIVAIQRVWSLTVFSKLTLVRSTTVSRSLVHTGLHEFGLSGIARAGSLCGGVAGWGGRVLGGRGEGSVEFGHFGALLLELRLMRKGVAKARLEAWQPGGDFGDRAALLRKLRLEATERGFEAGDNAERGDVLVYINGVG